MVSKDYYGSLGISKPSSPDEIKKAFRSLARKYHPDVCKEPDATKKFKEINEAYQVLSDPRKKQMYDTYGTTGPAGGFNASSFPDLEDILRDFTSSSPFGDMFESFFGGRQGTRQKKGPEPGNDLRYDLKLSLEEAHNGLEREVEMERLKVCGKCKGSGAEGFTAVKKCPQCGGSGHVTRAQRTILGSFSQIAVCDKCSGYGEIIENPCKTCKGSGRIRTKDKAKVTVPAGIDAGYRLKVTGFGDAGIRGGGYGDLYVFIDVKPHPLLRRDGDNLYTTDKIDFVSAALGDTAQLDIFGEAVELKIPAGTQPNTVFRVKGKGINKLYGHGRGDLFVEVQVEIPTRLSKEQAELLKKIKGAK